VNKYLGRKAVDPAVDEVRNECFWLLDAMEEAMGRFILDEASNAQSLLAWSSRGQERSLWMLAPQREMEVEHLVQGEVATNVRAD